MAVQIAMLSDWKLHHLKSWVTVVNCKFCWRIPAPWGDALSFVNWECSEPHAKAANFHKHDLNSSAIEFNTAESKQQLHFDWAKVKTNISVWNVWPNSTPLAPSWISKSYDGTPGRSSRCVLNRISRRAMFPDLHFVLNLLKLEPGWVTKRMGDQCLLGIRPQRRCSGPFQKITTYDFKGLKNRVITTNWQTTGPRDERYYAGVLVFSLVLSLRANGAQ